MASGGGDGSHNTRRGLILGGLGTAAAGMATVVTASTPVSAATGDPLILGQSNSATGATAIDATSLANVVGFQCNVTGTQSIALFGVTTGGIGAQGSDFGGPLNVSGIGLYGTSDLGTGVKGTSGASNGTGVWAENSNGGAALHVNGMAVFSRSGVAKVAAGASSVEVPSVALNSASFVLATAQRHHDSISVAAAVPHPAKSMIEIFLTGAAPKELPVGWFVIN